MAKQRDKVFPSPDAIVAFIRAQPEKVGTREIAREFGLKNADRAELKRILRELADEGVIAKRGKKITETASLPATMMADITGRDSDGELIATPTEWDEVENGEPPKIRIHIPRRPQPGTAAGVGTAPCPGASARLTATRQLRCLFIPPDSHRCGAAPLRRTLFWPPGGGFSGRPGDTHSGG